MENRIHGASVCARMHPKWKTLRGERLHLKLDDGAAVIVNKFGLVIASTFAYNFPENQLISLASREIILHVSEIRGSCFMAEFAPESGHAYHDEWNAV